MATLVLPMPTPFEFGRFYRILLDGDFFSFTFIWNARHDSWQLTIGSGDNVDVVRNLRMVVLEDILRPYRALGVPQGTLSVVDTSGQQRDPGERVEFGDRVQLQYTEVDAA